MASVLDEENVQKKLESVTSAQDSIQSMSMWIIHHKSHHKKIIDIWLKTLKKGNQFCYKMTIGSLASS